MGIIKDSNYLLFKRGLRLFKGLCLLFLPNVPGAMFIAGGTFIPDSRVLDSTKVRLPQKKLQNVTNILISARIN